MIRSRRTVIVAVASISIVAAGVALIQWRQLERRLEEARQEAARLARLLEEHTAAAVWAADLALIGIAESLGRQPNLPEHDPAFEDSLRRLLAKLPAVRALFVVGVDGFINQDSDPDTPRRNLADRDYFQAHVGGSDRGLYMDAPLISRSVGTWFVGLSRRVETEQREFIGVAVAALELRYIERFYEELGLRADDVITLTTRDGVLFARTPRADERVGRRLGPDDGPSALERALALAPVGTFDAVSTIDGVPRLFAYRALADHPLVVVVGLSRERVVASWLADAASAALATFVAFALAALLMWLAMRYARAEAAAQARVAEATRLSALGRLTSGVAHDFANLLQAMDAALSALRQRIPEDAYASQVIEHSLASLERGRSLVTQLLGVARPKESLPQRLDLNATLEGMATLLRNAAAPMAKLELELADDLPHCLADPGGLETALLNLVVNARDAMQRGRAERGSVRISTGNCAEPIPTDAGRTLAAGRFVRVSVQDNGAGMSPEVRRRALEPFFTTKGEKGTGLGLAQVDDFVRQSGGVMQIETKVGGGTAVHLYLPRA